MDILITVDDREYKVDKSKLKKWLRENIKEDAPTSEDLIIDIEDTIGVEIEFNELEKEEAKETKKEK